ncbi:MAG: type IV secretory system conjugative DNA transfer family protein [Lachnospiraceae bacterium]|nr:type IV secretory system conjugative DNA transfer family protein [Lachnospiraceae bacterium]
MTDPRKMRTDVVLPNGDIVNNDDYETRINGNMVAFGSTGASKTRSISETNLAYTAANQEDISQIVVDMKGTLSRKYAQLYRENGYDVKILSFSNTRISNKYSPLKYVKTTEDIASITDYFIKMDGSEDSHQDPFWDNAARFLINHAIYESLKEENFSNICNILREKSTWSSGFRKRFINDERDNSWGDLQFKNACVQPDKTYHSTVSVALAKFSSFESEEIKELLSEDEMDLHNLYKKKTIIFVEISDVDQSKNVLANLFINQAMQVLCEDATHYKNGRLPMQVRFICDDYGVGCVIHKYPLYLPNMRSKGINSIILTQSYSQLKSYHDDNSANTILANCDTQIFMGGIDIDTCNYFAELFDMPAKKIKNLPREECLIYRRGYMEAQVRKMDIDEFLDKHNITLPEPLEGDYKLESDSESKEDRRLREEVLREKIRNELLAELHETDDDFYDSFIFEGNPDDE